MQTVAQVKEEIYNRMAIIAEPRAKYVPGANKRVDALIEEMKQIAGQRAAGQAIPEQFRPRFSEIVTELHTEKGFSQKHLADMIQFGSKNLAKYIRPGGEKRYYDESRLAKPENKESLLADLDRIKDRKISGKVRDDDKPRLSEILTKLHIAYGISENDLSKRFEMERNTLARYIHVTTAVPIQKQFTPGLNPAKKMWWKQSGKSYKEIWSFAQYITGISPIKSRADYEKIAIEAADYLNIDDKVKGLLWEYISSEQGGAMQLQSMSGYRSSVELPIMFIQWLSETKNKEITFSDLSLKMIEGGLVVKTPNPNGITSETLDNFSKDWVPERTQDNKSIGLKTRSITSIIHVFDYAPKFQKYLAVKSIIEYPFKDLKYPTRPQKGEDEDVGPVYNINELAEIFNKIIPAKDQGIKLFMRLLLQAGSRPEQIVSIKCKDIINTPVTTDAFGKTFYIINTSIILSEGKAERGENVVKKFSTRKAYISEGLMNDFKAWMVQRKLKPEDPIFLPNAEGRGFMTLDGMRNRISFGAHTLTGYKRMKVTTPEGDEKEMWVRDESRPILLSHTDPKFYKPYGMRKTFASVLYALTGEQGYVIRAGGWQKGSTVPWEYYTRLMKAADALAIFKKYEIYIDPDATTSSGKPFREHIKTIDVTAAPAAGTAIGTDEFKLMRSQIEAIMKTQEEKDKVIAELMRRLAEKGI